MSLQPCGSDPTLHFSLLFKEQIYCGFLSFLLFFLVLLQPCDSDPTLKAGASWLAGARKKSLKAERRASRRKEMEGAESDALAVASAAAEGG